MDNRKPRVQCSDHNKKIKFICIKNTEKDSNLFACYDCLRQKPNCIPFICMNEILESNIIQINEYLVNNQLPDVRDEQINKMIEYLASQKNIVKTFFQQIQKQLTRYLDNKKEEILKKFDECEGNQKDLTQVLTDVTNFYNGKNFRNQMKEKISQLNIDNQIQISNDIRKYLLEQENVYQANLKKIKELYQKCETDLQKTISVDYRKQTINELAQYVLFMTPMYNFEKSKFDQSAAIIQEKQHLFKNVVGQATQTIIGCQAFSQGTHQLIIKILKKPTNHFYLSLCDNTTKPLEPISGCLTGAESDFENSNFLDVLKDGSNLKMIMDFSNNMATITEVISQKTAYLSKKKSLNTLKDLRFAITWLNTQQEIPVEIIYCD